MSTLEKAIEISAKAHSGQTDKSGTPYILHPLKVMMRVDGIEEKIVAVLHDIVEDTDITLSVLNEEGFSDAIVNAVDALTKRVGETRMDAAKRAAENPIALIVKLADNAENMDLSRIEKPTSRDYERQEEYKAVRKYLLSRSNA
ncbi:HD domain-containing protein [Vreelandella venusta]|uniref:HD domain-containing protein n=1 Tax=Vreelandella venusta TaxID=44935 RepID=UPI0022860D15|nr:HD domain-containing protein [Halomonas venusta]WAM53714.1 HD domain-containing protein [Halomonas venusta]